MYMVEVHPEGISAIIDGSGSTTLWFGEAEEAFLYNVRENKETVEVKCLTFDNGGDYSSLPIKFCVENGNVMLKMVLETPLQFGVTERLRQTFRAESTRLRAAALKMLWADLVSTTYLIYRIPYIPIGFCISEEEWIGKDTSLVHLKLEQLDVKTTFLHGDLDEYIYMTQPSVHVKEKSVWIKVSTETMILGMKSHVEMFIRLVMNEKLEFCAASTSLRCVSYVRGYRKVRAVALLKGRWFEVHRDYLRQRVME
ncbi:retrovirus-related pol polyprotein from transposon TNT 1-94 [Tanacetum coccineum]